MATLNGRVYTLATLRGSSGYAYATSDDRGLPLWPDAIFTDMLAELETVKAGGGLVSGSLGVSAGDKAITLTQAMSLPAGLYLAYRTSELNAPVNGFFGVLGTAINSGTSGTLTVGASGLIGTGGTYGDFVLVPAPARRQPQRLVSSSDVATSDFGAVIRFTGATGGTLGIPVGSLGAGFPFSVVNNGTGTFILDPSGTLLIGTQGTLVLCPGESIEGYVNGTGVSILSGYFGAPLKMWPTIMTGTFAAPSGWIYPVDTASAAASAQLDSAPAVTARVGFIDVAHSFSTNNCTLDRNGTANKIDGTAANFVLNVSGLGAVLAQTGTTYGWRL